MPANQEGIVKVSNHGVGRSLTPASPDRLVTPAEKAHLFDFLKQTFPRLADAPLVYSHVCLYTDTWDGHFWIAADPEREGLMLATGGSGHAFKFAPVLGDIIADALQGVSTPLLERFRWRPELRLARGEEAARCRG